MRVKFRHRSTVTHNVMNLSYVQNIYVHSGKLKVKKIWLYGARFGSPHDVQTLSLVISMYIIHPVLYVEVKHYTVGHPIMDTPNSRHLCLTDVWSLYWPILLYN